jgi:PAS domain S-box-containing protein
VNALGSNVLIVEDDRGTAFLQTRRLQQAGYNVSDVATVVEALQHLESHPTDLIVLDYNLSGPTNGLEFYAQIKSAGLNLPVIMVTGSEELSTIIEALRHGVRDFVVKSLEYLDYLPIAVERVLNHLRVENQLAHSEARFRSFMDNGPMLAFVKDGRGQYVYANRLFETTLGCENWFGKSDSDLLPDRIAQRQSISDRTVLSENRPLEFSEIVPVKDGQEQEWNVYKFPVEDAGGERFVGGVAIDVTQRRRTEEALRQRDEQLRQAQKMEAIGTLAGGIAHEFNNLLQVIQGYTGFAAEGLPSEDPRRRDLQQVLVAAERAKLLTRQLLSFGHRQILQFTNVEMNDIVRDALEMLKPLIGEHISLELALGDRAGTVHADAGQLQQLLINLCVNARDAMPDGGQLRISTSHRRLTAEYCEYHSDVQPGEYFVLSVTDSGCGMSPEVKQHIFEPFYTTKEVGRGTGLGLAMVYGLVQQHLGIIRVYSELDLGTTFKIYLPTIDEVADSDAVSSSGAIRGGTETILVAEDEPMVRELVVRMLRGAGYRTVEAGDGELALQTFLDHANEIDLLLLDVIMPKRNGREVFQRIKQLKPEIKTLFCSGYDPETCQVDFASANGIRLVQKPYDPAELLEAVRESLDEKSICHST